MRHASKYEILDQSYFLCTYNVMNALSVPEDQQIENLLRRKHHHNIIRRRLLVAPEDAFISKYTGNQEKTVMC